MVKMASGWVPPYGGFQQDSKSTTECACPCFSAGPEFVARVGRPGLYPWALLGIQELLSPGPGWQWVGKGLERPWMPSRILIRLSPKPSFQAQWRGMGILWTRVRKWHLASGLPFPSSSSVPSSNMLGISLCKVKRKESKSMRLVTLLRV